MARSPRWAELTSVILNTSTRLRSSASQALAEPWTWPPPGIQATLTHPQDAQVGLDSHAVNSLEHTRFKQCHERRIPFIRLS